MIPRRLASILLAVSACATGGGAARDPAPAAPSSAAPAKAGSADEKTSSRSTALSASAPHQRELSPRAQRLFEEALAAAEEQKRLKVPTDWEQLERRWRKVTEAEPVPEAWFNLGVALEKRRQLDDARAAYRRALEIEPALAPAAVNLALLEEPKDPRQSAQVWAELSRRFPDDPVPRQRLAALYLAAGQRDEAWKLAREALVRDPRAVGAYKVMMRVALERGNADFAHLLAVKARKLDDGDPEIVAFVGDVLLQQKDEPGAVAQWKKAIALKDDYLPARRALLANALGKGHWEGVAEQAHAILRSGPEPRVQLALGIANRYLGQPDKALAAYDLAERTAGGKLPEVHLARAIVLMKLKEQCEPALAELRRYQAAVGPAAASEGPALRMQRECEQILIASKQAEEAAREMKAEAERQAAKKAPTPAPAQSSPGAQAPATGGKGGKAPLPRGAELRADQGREHPTR
jgi:tetratricopeptide (TPR) repeat protein